MTFWQVMALFAAILVVGYAAAWVWCWWTGRDQ